MFYYGLSGASNACIIWIALVCINELVEKQDFRNRRIKMAAVCVSILILLSEYFWQGQIYIIYLDAAGIVFMCLGMAMETCRFFIHGLTAFSVGGILLIFIRNKAGGGTPAVFMTAVFLCLFLCVLILFLQNLSLRLKHIKNLYFAGGLMVTMIFVQIIVKLLFRRSNTTVIYSTAQIDICVWIFTGLLIVAFLMDYLEKMLLGKSRRAAELIVYANNEYGADRIMRMYREASALRHDIKHYVQSASVSMQNQDYETARRLLDELTTEKVRPLSLKLYCEDSVLNYMINSKFYACEQKGITVKCCSFGSVEHMSKLDLSILIGNLLDNAIEAAQQAPDPFVTLEIFTEDEISIQVDNAIRTSVLSGRRPFATTKADRRHHGIGIQSIRKIVYKYGGKVEYTEKGKVMQCKITFPK